MRTYIAMGQDDESLERLLAQHDVECTFRGRYVPVVALRSELELDELRQLLPEYIIEEQKEYTIERRKEP